MDPHPDPLAVDVRLSGGTASVVISGDLDLASTPSLAARLRDILTDQPRRLVFDLSRVGFMDCAAARLIAGTARSLPDGQRPVIRSASPLVRRVLELTGLADQCELV
jgi:anti-anti-sigma factor